MVGSRVILIEYLIYSIEYKLNREEVSTTMDLGFEVTQMQRVVPDKSVVFTTLKFCLALSFLSSESLSFFPHL